MYFALCAILFTPFQAADESPGLDQAEFKLRQLMRFELSDKGQLKLKRDHWELISKKPAEKEKTARDANGNEPRLKAARLLPARIAALRIPPRVAADEPAISKLFKQIMAECGANQRSSSRGNNRSMSRFGSLGSTPSGVQGEIISMANIVSLRAEEVDGQLRTIQLTDEEDRSSFQLLLKDGLVRIVTRPKGFRLDSVIKGKVLSVTGTSFVAAVHKDREYFEKVLKPAIRKVAILPIDDALKATPSTDNTSDFDLKLTKFPDAQWANENSEELISALLQFHFVDGRLRRQGESAGKEMFEKELSAAKEKVDAVLKKSVARMKANGASPILIAELKRQMTPSDRPVGRAHFRANMPQSLEARLFMAFVDSIGGSAGTRTSSDGSFSFQSNTNGMTAEIDAPKGTVATIKLGDSEVQVAVSETAEATRILISSSGGVLTIVDGEDGASVVLVDEDQPVALQGDSLKQVFDENKELVTARIVPVLKKYGIGVAK